MRREQSVQLLLHWNTPADLRPLSTPHHNPWLLQCYSVGSTGKPNSNVFNRVASCTATIILSELNAPYFFFFTSLSASHFGMCTFLSREAVAKQTSSCDQLQDQMIRAWVREVLSICATSLNRTVCVRIELYMYSVC